MVITALKETLVEAELGSSVGLLQEGEAGLSLSTCSTKQAAVGPKNTTESFKVKPLWVVQQNVMLCLFLLVQIK